MIKKILNACLAALFFLIFTQEMIADEAKEWSYKNDASKQWAGLSELYLGCKDGRQQSPIKINTKNVKSGAETFSIKYAAAKGVNVRLEHHTFKIAYPKGSFIEMGGSKYFLQEIHLKTPAENMIDNLSAPLEAQFYHEDSKGRVLILSVLFTDSRSNATLDLIIKNLPTTQGKSHFITNVDANALLPKNHASYQFYGSLTYPPCSQDVYWIVLKQPMSVIQNETDALREITGANAREVQDVFDRLITTE